MTNSGQDGYFRGSDFARKKFVVENGKIVGRATAADDDDNIVFGFFVKIVNCTNDFVGSGEALNITIGDGEVEAAPSFVEDFNKIGIPGSTGRGDDGEVGRAFGERALFGGVKKPFF